MERVLWVHSAYQYLKKAAALTPKAIVVCCHVCLAFLTVDLVWVGLINQGVRSAVPGIVRAEALAHFEEGMSPADVALAESCYSAPNASGIRRFVGDPNQLHPLSRLSRALSRTASGAGLGPRAGVKRVHDEYQKLGIPLTVTRSAYVVRSVHDLLCCLTVLLVMKNRQEVLSYLYQFVTSCAPRD